MPLYTKEEYQDLERRLLARVNAASRDAYETHDSLCARGDRIAKALNTNAPKCEWYGPVSGHYDLAIGPAMEGCDRPSILGHRCFRHATIEPT